MTEHPLDPWMTNAPGPFVTMSAGGPFEGVVTISVATPEPARLVVEAAWNGRGGRGSAEPDPLSRAG